MPFVKGQSGNPGGRPKQVDDIKEYVRSRSMENIERIVMLAESAEDEGTRLKACIALQEIAWGRPQQAMAITGADGGPLVVSWAEKPKA